MTMFVWFLQGDAKFIYNFILFAYRYIEEVGVVSLNYCLTILKT